MFKNYKVNVDKNHRSYVKLTFIANADTTVPVYYTKESFTAKKPDKTISLKANEQKTTTINKSEIYRFGLVDYDPSTGKYISSNINIISARIEGTILDGYGLFDRVKSMTECDVSKMDTSKMTSMFCMFQLCSALTALDVTHFDTSKVTDMSYMFYDCSKLTTVGPVDTASGWQHKPNKYDNMFNNCPATPKPSWYKQFNNNGFEYVDLGLPSGTLWATCNVGASKSSDYGLYFQWGDTVGYTANQIGTGEGQKKFMWDDYKFSVHGSDSNFSKYTTLNAKLDLEDDAAHVNMGGDWHMPSSKQIRELLNTTAQTISDDESGITFTSMTNGKSIFIPAAGYAWVGSVSRRGHIGSVWSSMSSSFAGNVGQCLDLNLDFDPDDEFNSEVVSLSGNLRSYGLSVRGVLG